MNFGLPRCRAADDPADRADHNIAWRVRKALGLDNVPSGVAPGRNDGIIYDITGSHGNLESKSGFGHPLCGGTEQAIAKSIGAGG